MSFEACIFTIKSAVPDLTEDEITQLFEDLEVARDLKMSTGEANSTADATEKAAKELMDSVRRGAIQHTKDLMLNEYKAARLAVYAQDQFGDDLAKGFEAKMVGVEGVKGESRDSAHSLQHAKHEEYLGGMRADLEVAGVYELYGSNAMETEVAKALRALRTDQPTSGLPKEAIQIAEIIRKWQDKSNADLISVGVPLHVREDYLERQTHDYVKLRHAAGLGVSAADPRHFETWRDFISPLLDETKTRIDDKYLREAFVGLVSGDHLRPEPTGISSGFMGPSNLAKKITAQRTLHFKSPEAWLEYNRRFGMDHLAGAVEHSLERKAEQYGLLYHFGTNPRYTLRRAHDLVAATMRAPEKAAELRAFNDTLPALERQMSFLDGTVNVAENELLAEWGTGIRVLESMVKLPLMLLSQFGDLATFASEMRYSTGKSFLGGLKDAIVGIGEGMSDIERKKLFSLIGVHADGTIADLAAKFGSIDNSRGRMQAYQQKFFGMVGAHWWNGRMRRRAGEVISHSLALERGSDFDSLNANMKRAFGLYGIGAEEWDQIRANAITVQGREFVVPEGIGGETERKLRVFIADRVDYAVLNPDAKTNYYMMWGTDLKRGTPAGEAIRFVMQFKGYPISFVQRVLGREVKGYGANTLGEALTNKNGELVGLAQLAVYTTALGYLSMTAKELAKGKKPRDVTEPGVAWRTFMAAAMQGGGLGIYGDFLFGEANRGGVGTAGTLLGPAISDVVRANDIFKRAIRGEGSVGEVTRFAISTAAGAHPAASAVINGYPRIVLDYLFLYRMMEEMDPGYLRRMERRLERENAQEFMFPPSQYAR